MQTQVDVLRFLCIIADNSYRVKLLSACLGKMYVYDTVLTEPRISSELFKKYLIHILYSMVQFEKKKRTEE